MLGGLYHIHALLDMMDKSFVCLVGLNHMPTKYGSVEMMEKSLVCLVDFTTLRTDPDRMKRGECEG